MVATYLLPSGTKVSRKWKPSKSEFSDTLGIHSPFKTMAIKDRKQAIEKDWKALSKLLSKDKTEETKKEEL